LRGPVDELKLITPRDTVTREYRPNTEWTSKYPDLNFGQRTELERILKEFAFAYDEIIELIVSDWIRIRGQDHPNGMFSIELNALIVRQLKSLSFDCDDLIDFSATAFDYFQGLLDLPLRNIQTRLSSQTKPEFERLFLKLREDVNHVFGSLPCFELQSAISTAFTNVQDAVNTAISWFTLSSTEELKAIFWMDDIISAAADITKTTHKGQSLSITSAIDVPIALGADLFSELIDIFSALFDNIHRRAGLGSEASAYIEANMLGENVLSIRVENPIYGEITSDIHLRLDYIRGIIERGEFTKYTKREGGSGLLKIMNTISPHAINALDFGFEDENAKFFVSIQMSISLREIAPSIEVT
jgi:hypothetical protein